MTCSRFLWVLIVVANVGFAGRMNGADAVKPDAAKTNEREAVIKTVRLNHTEAQIVANTLRSFEDVNVQLAPIDSDRLVVRGSAEAVRNVVDKYIPAIDVPGTLTSQGTAEYLRVQHYPIHELMDLVRTVAPSARIGLDELNRTIVVNANPNAVAGVRELLKQIDLPTKSVNAQFFFIRAGKPAQGDAKEGTLPVALQPIGKTLAENGFSQPALLAPLTVTIQEGRKFESNSVLRTEGSDKQTDIIALMVSGMVRLQPGSDVVQLDVEARMGGIVEPGRADYGPTFELKTTLAAKLGTYTILAAAPSTMSQGDAVALVVRVTAY